MNLIPLSYLNEACFLSMNVDDKKYSMVLKLAQDDLSDVLGAEFYEEIQTQYSANPQTLTADNIALYDGYIKDFLAWQTYFHHLKFSNSDSTPTGEREFTDENSTVLSDVKMFAKEKHIKSIADRYKYKMINFLKLEQEKDSTKYPLYEGGCEDQNSFYITAVDKTSDALIEVNKKITTNE